MKPTSFKQYLAKSVIVRANWLTKELQELERLRAWEKISKCYNCDDLVSRTESTTCAFCCNRNCGRDQCAMFCGFDNTDDPMCNECSKKRCALCYKVSTLTKCIMPYCTSWVCDECTKNVVCSCGIKSRYCSERCFTDCNPDVCYNCDRSICPHDGSAYIPCLYPDCNSTICRKCFKTDEYCCGEHLGLDDSEDELVKLAKLLV